MGKLNTLTPNLQPHPHLHIYPCRLSPPLPKPKQKYSRQCDLRLSSDLVLLLLVHKWSHQAPDVILLRFKSNKRKFHIIAAIIHL